MAPVFHDSDPGIRTVPAHHLREGQREKRILQLRARLLETSPQARLAGTQVTGPHDRHAHGHHLHGLVNREAC